MKKVDPQISINNTNKSLSKELTLWHVFFSKLDLNHGLSIHRYLKENKEKVCRNQNDQVCEHLTLILANS